MSIGSANPLKFEISLDFLPHKTWLLGTGLVLTVSVLAQLWYTKGGRHRDGARDKSIAEIDCFELSGTPPPNPALDFDIEQAKPRPYRPFRWKYYQTMSLAPLEHDWWIELESTYRGRIQQRRDLYVKHGQTILDSLPGSEAACQELMFMVIQFLCARYPRLFSFKRETQLFTNEILGTTDSVGNVEPLKFLLNNVPEDFIITLKDPVSGLYHLRAGICCSAVGWSMKTKMGRPLHEIHEPVPDYAERLRPSIDKYFDKMPCDKPIQRGSWSFEVGQPLFLQTDDPQYLEHKRYNPDLNVDDIHLRVDWQTLRRLPQSKAIVFNFKALFTPVGRFREEPYIPQLVAKVLRESQLNIKEYQGWSILEHKLLPALDGWAQEQISRKMVPESWEERTLDEHPFYPGWKDKYNQVVNYD